MVVETYAYRELLEDVISPVAISVLDRLTPQIGEIYNLGQLLDAQLPRGEQSAHEERFVERLTRIVRLLPPDVSPMANEIFTAIEFLIYEVHGEPVKVGIAWARLEELGEEIRADPLLYSLLTGKAN